MPQLDGKQIKDLSTSLGKLSGTGVVTFNGATMSFGVGSTLRQRDENILVGHDVVNKNYVDAVAQGLHIKDSVHVISLSPITLSGTQSIDDHLLYVGDRVLVNGQDNTTATSSNGIYVVDSASWLRATDADGIGSSGEVQIGDFVFVAYGTTYSGTSWVLSQSDSTDFDILVGTESQHWTQFSSAGNITAGDGLVQTGNQFDVNVGTGLTISTIDNSLSLGTTSVVAATYGSSTEIPSITVDQYGRITGASTYSISIPPQFEFGTGLTANGLTVSVNFESITGTGLTQNGSQISIDTDGLAISLSGAGLTQNGGTISVNVENGLSIDSNSNKIVLGGDLTKDTIISGTGFGLTVSVDNINITATSSLITINNGQGFVYSATPSNAVPLTLVHKQYVDNQIGGLADVDNKSLILNINNEIQISPTAAGQGLTFSDSTGIIDIIWGGTGSGLTFSTTDDSLGVNVDGTTIQINGNGQLTVVAGASTPVYQLVAGTTSTGDNYPTGITLSYTPNDYSRVEVYVNGQKQRLGDGVISNVDCYFDSTGKQLINLSSGDQLYWNGLYAGYELSTSDSIEIVYEK